MRDNPQRILIVRLSAIGDVVLATSLLPPLRRAYPQAEITWLTEEAGGEILEANDLLDRLIVLPRRRWKQLWKERKLAELARGIRAKMRELRSVHPDLVLDAQGLLRSALWARLAGGRRRIGIGRRECNHRFMHESIDVGPDFDVRMCDGYRRMIEHLGIESEPFCMSLRAPEPARRAAEAAPRPILLFPFTTRPQKHWYNDRWAALAQLLRRQAGLPVWILGGPSDEAGAQEIAAAAGGAIERIVAGRSSNLAQKMALIERSAGAVGVDTGLTHMSLGLNVPTVVLFGSTYVYNDTAPLPGRVLYHRMPCSPCHRSPVCGGEFTCMRGLQVPQVARALAELLEQGVAR